MILLYHELNYFWDFFLAEKMRKMVEVDSGGNVMRQFGLIIINIGRKKSGEPKKKSDRR